MFCLMFYYYDKLFIQIRLNFIFKVKLSNLDGSCRPTYKLCFLQSNKNLHALNNHPYILS